MTKSTGMGGLNQKLTRATRPIRMIKHNHVLGKDPGVTGEFRFMKQLFNLAG